MSSLLIEFGHEKPVSTEDYNYQSASESLIYLSIKSDDFMVFRIETSESVEFKENRILYKGILK